MRTTTSKFFGAYKVKKQIFISKSLRHIELYECGKILGVKVWEEEREVFIPPFAELSRDDFQLLYDVYLELFNAAKDIKNWRE